MKLTIHNVGHGSCVSLLHQDGNVMLWDCGHQEGYRPSIFLPQEGIDKIDYLFITNYDEDHISDLPQLRDKLRVRSIFRNNSISVDELRYIKSQAGPISSAMESMLGMMATYTGGPLDPAPDFPNVRFRTFKNDYSDSMSDTNNISLVTFLECGSTKFVFPGDLECKGWEALLGSDQFIKELSGVHVFLASHHGRESGYCRQVFDHCSPNVVIFSDSGIRHATQEMAQLYGNHAVGIQFNGKTRSVLSTRNDGSLTWTID